MAESGRSASGSGVRQSSHQLRCASGSCRLLPGVVGRADVTRLVQFQHPDPVSDGEARHASRVPRGERRFDLGVGDDTLLLQGVDHRLEPAAVERERLVFLDAERLEGMAQLVEADQAAGGVAEQVADRLDPLLPFQLFELDPRDRPRRVAADVVIAAHHPRRMGKAARYSSALDGSNSRPRMACLRSPDAGTGRSASRIRLPASAVRNTRCATSA